MIIDNENYSLKGYQVKELVEKVKERDAVFQTIFYMNASETGATRHIYKKSDMTDPATSKDVFDANDKGQVILRISTSATPDMYSDAYLQNAYSATGDYQLLFLDEKTYRSFDTTNLTDSAFIYSARVIQDKITAGTNIQINGSTISATDTTYSDFTGTDGTQTGIAGLVPAPVATDAGKFLKADGTWGVAGGSGPTVVQTTGTSTTDVMSQNAVTTELNTKATITMTTTDPGEGASINENQLIGVYS